jgi:hypothetical protein
MRTENEEPASLFSVLGPHFEVYFFPPASFSESQ